MEEALFKELKQELADYLCRLQVEKDHLSWQMWHKMKAFHDVQFYTGSPPEQFVSSLRYALDRRDHEEWIETIADMRAWEKSLRAKMNKLWALQLERQARSSTLTNVSRV
jgi:hypothetical protein